MRLLVLAFLVYAPIAFGFERGEKVISGGVHRIGDSYSVRVRVTKFQPERSDQEYRSLKKTDLKVVLRDIKGVEVESAYLIAREKEVSFGASTNPPPNKRSKSNEASSPDDEAFSYFIFKYLPSASSVELFVRGRLVTTAPISDKN